MFSPDHPEQLHFPPQKPPTVIKIEDSPPESQLKPSSFTIKIEVDDFKKAPISEANIETDDQGDEEEAEEETPETTDKMEAIIHKMLESFINSSPEFNAKAERAKYAYSEILSLVFDQLNEKFASASKCREDMIRVVMRKALQYLQKQIQEPGLKCKELPRMFCHKYFTEEFERLEEKRDEKAIQTMINKTFPYKKGSTNKTVNSTSIKTAFSSDTFAHDYATIFLPKFLAIMEKDNMSKFKKFKKHLVKCVSEQNIEGLKNFKRIPWLKKWILDTQKVAQELNDPESNRRVKKPIYKKNKTD